jgi:hypothetical protein
MKDLQEMPTYFKTVGPNDDASGHYMIPHHLIKDYHFFIVFSYGLGWEHMSVTLRKQISSTKKTTKPVDRCPTWPEMCFLKDMFWNPDECCVQYHPPMSQYISNAEFCLHIWRPTEVELPAPDAALVGVKSLGPVMEWLKGKFPLADEKSLTFAVYYCDGHKFDPKDSKFLDKFELDVKLYLETL